MDITLYHAVSKQRKMHQDDRGTDHFMHSLALRFKILPLK